MLESIYEQLLIHFMLVYLFVSWVGLPGFDLKCKQKKGKLGEKLCLIVARHFFQNVDTERI